MNKPAHLSTQEAVLTLLKSKGVQYRLIEHDPAFTSEDVTRIGGIEPSQVAKALVMLADGKPFLVILPCSRKVDFKKFKSLTGVRNLEMAAPEQVQRICGVEVGAVPPLGNLFGLPTYIDVHLTNEEQIVFSAGSHVMSIRMSYGEFRKIVSPVVGDYTKEAG